MSSSRLLARVGEKQRASGNRETKNLGTTAEPIWVHRRKALVAHRLLIAADDEELLRVP